MDFYGVLDKILDTKDVTIGGGSAAALSGAMASGLIGMVSLLSRGKNLGLSDSEYERIEQECVVLRAALLEGCVQDAAAYGAIVAAYKLPKSTDEEKAARSAAIQQAGYFAASVPRDNGRYCAQVLELGRSVEKNFNPSAASDLLYGMGLARLGIAGCIANIEANLSLIKDEHKKTELLDDISRLKEFAE